MRLPASVCFDIFVTSKRKNFKRKRIPFYMPRNGDDLSLEARVYKSSMFITDALRGQDLRYHRIGKWSSRIDGLLNSKKYDYMMFALVLLHMALVMWEPPSGRLADLPKYADRFTVLLLSLLYYSSVCVFNVFVSDY